MKKYIIGGVIVLALAAYLIFATQKPTTTDTNTAQTSTTGNTTTDPGTTTTTGGTPTPTPTPTATTSGYKDGTYTGSVQTEIYGTVQVAAVISGGKITDIQFIQFPNLPGHTQEVTAEAEPVLKQEAISTQNAQVNIVTGATQDSQAFQASLATALSQAAS